VKLRSVLLAATLIASGMSVVSVAEAKAPPCKTIVDPAGDSAYGNPLDIVSADIASNKKTVTAVFRLAEINKTNSSAPTGQGYYFDFTAGGATPIYLSYTVTPTTEAFTYGYVDGNLHRSIGEATGKVDPAKKEIRISAPVGSWTTYGNPKVGSKITGVTLTTYWVLGAYASTPVTTGSTGGGSLQPADDAAGKTYVAGSPSCVVPGK
jgi:hypothetical protein